jgi:RNA polymerase sigma-70 factor, ECF subfamily
MMAGAGPFPEPDGVGPLDERRLVDRAVGGDHDAFRTLWATVEARSYALCLRLTGNRADAADALQETQIAVWSNLHRFEGRAAFGAWVFAIARNAALAVIRSRGRRAEDDLGRFGERPADPYGRPFTDVVIDSLTVQGALERLRAEHRDALLLWVGGLTYRQVADVMGAPLSSVRVWIHRARSVLRESMSL